MLLLTCGFAAAFNVEGARHGRFSNSYLPLAVDGCPSPVLSPVPAPSLQPRNSEIVTVLSSSLLIGSPGDTVTLKGTLTNTTSETYVFGGVGGTGVKPICWGNAPECVFLGTTGHFPTDPIPPHSSTGEVAIEDFHLNPAYTGPLPTVVTFTFYTFRPGMFSGLATYSIRVQPRTDPSRPPLLFTDPCTQRAVALDSVFLTREPFTPGNLSNFSSDQRTRVALFAWNMNLEPGEGADAVTVQAIDSQQATHLLPVEFVSDVTGEPGLTQIVVRLPDNLPTGNDLRLRIMIHGFTSNEAPMATKGNASV